MAITLVLAVDGLTALALFRYRAREPGAPFLVPLYPFTPVLFVLLHATLLIGAAIAAPGATGVAFLVLGAAWAASRGVRDSGESGP